MNSHFCNALLATLLVAGSGAAAATPLLQCRLQQGDIVMETRAAPTTDPYHVAAVQVGHFRFKAVVVGDDARVDYVKLYTYYEAPGKAAPDARLLQEARYLAPRPQRGAAPASLTGAVLLYEPRLGREFGYDCALREEDA